MPRTSIRGRLERIALLPSEEARHAARDEEEKEADLAHDVFTELEGDPVRIRRVAEILLAQASERSRVRNRNQ